MGFFSYIKKELHFPWAQGNAGGNPSRIISLFSYFWDAAAEDAVYVRNQFNPFSCADRYLGRWRLPRIIRHSDETDDNYRERLNNAGEIYSTAGTLPGIKNTLKLELPNLAVEVHIPGKNGWKIGSGKIGTARIGASYVRFEVVLIFPQGATSEDRALAVLAAKSVKAARDRIIERAEFIPAGSGFAPWKIGTSKIGSMLIS